jgi:hypothetical protein
MQACTKQAQLSQQQGTLQICCCSLEVAQQLRQLDWQPVDIEYVAVTLNGIHNDPAHTAWQHTADDG